MKKIELNTIQELLEIYGIQDEEYYSSDIIQDEDGDYSEVRYSFSETILNELHTLIGYEEHNRIASEFKNDFFNKMQDLANVYDFLCKCTGKVTMKGSMLNPQGKESKLSISIDSSSINTASIKDAIRKELESTYPYSHNGIDSRTIDKNLVPKISKAKPKSHDYGSACRYLIEHLRLNKQKDFRKNQKLYSFVYDLLSIDNPADDCKELGEKGRYEATTLLGRRKAEIVRTSWLRAIDYKLINQ